MAPHKGWLWSHVHATQGGYGLLTSLIHGKRLTVTILGLLLASSGHCDLFRASVCVFSHLWVCHLKFIFLIVM